VWTKNFKSSAAEEDLEGDDVEMTGEGGGSGKPSGVDEDPFEKHQMVSLFLRETIWCG
jgi:hypothetical protein